MLHRTKHADGVIYYFSPLLRAAGIPHAFSTRIGGRSPEPFHSLNLGNPNGCEIQDDYDRIWENYRLLHAAAGCLVEKPCRVHQVHGAEVVRVMIDEEFDTATKADALVSDDPRRVLSVRVADCVPVLIASNTGNSVAAIHAGWRGVVAGVVPTALGALVGNRPAHQFLAAIGPCIGYEAFEVGPEVVAEFSRTFGSRSPAKMLPDGKGRIDLREAVRRQLIAAGIPAGQIDSSDQCTYENREEFFSHRRDNGITGRMAAIIQCRGDGVQTLA